MLSILFSSTSPRATALNLVSPVVNRLGVTSVYRRLSATTCSRSVAILMYHRVVESPNWAKGLSIKTISATPRQFEDHLQLLCDRFEVLSLEGYVDRVVGSKKVSPNTVILTFDDGYRDNFLYAFPLLKKYHLPATIFLATGLIGSSRLPWWDRMIWHISQTRAPQVEVNGIGWLPLTTSTEKHFAIYTILRALKLMRSEQIGPILEELIRKLGRNPADEPRERLFLSWEEVREMYRNGISFGCHSVSHPNLAELDTQEIQREVRESKEAIESELRTVVRTFAYPFGQQDNFDTRVSRVVRDAGFSCAVSALYGRHNQKGDLFALHRIPVFSTQSCEVLYLKLSGLFDRLAKLT